MKVYMLFRESSLANFFDQHAGIVSSMKVANAWDAIGGTYSEIYKLDELPRMSAREEQCFKRKLERLK